MPISVCPPLKGLRSVSWYSVTVPFFARSPANRVVGPELTRSSAASLTRFTKNGDGLLNSCGSKRNRSMPGAPELPGTHPAARSPLLDRQHGSVGHVDTDLVQHVRADARVEDDVVGHACRVPPATRQTMRAIEPCVDGSRDVGHPELDGQNAIAIRIDSALALLPPPSQSSASCRVSHLPDVRGPCSSRRRTRAYCQVALRPGFSAGIVVIWAVP